MATPVGGADTALHSLVQRDALSGAGKAGAWAGKTVAKAFGAGKRKQAEYAAGAARAATQVANKYMPHVKAKLREVGVKVLKKGLGYAGFKRGGRVTRRKRGCKCGCGGKCKMMRGGKVRSQFHFKH